MKEATANKRRQAAEHEKNNEKVPRWLIVMYNTIFFGFCNSHPNQKEDRFCIDCLGCFCSHCLRVHSRRHKCFKIRRYLYNDVINRKDLCKLFNCSGIQTYQTNKAKVIFLKKRSHPHQQEEQQQQHQQQQHNNSKDYSCIICEWGLQDPMFYCSIACKVSAIHGEKQEEATAHDDFILNHEKDEAPENDKEEDDEDNLALTLASLIKGRKLKRKGVPLRAPMF